MAHYSSVQDGLASAASTWDHGTLVPGPGDTVDIWDHVEVDASVSWGDGTIGTSTWGAPIALVAGGSLTVSGVGTTLTIDGDFFANDLVLCEAGTTIEFENAGLSHFDIRTTGGVYSALKMQGTQANPCEFGSRTGGGVWVSGVVSASSAFGGHGRTDSTWCTFVGIGNATQTTGWYVNQLGQPAGQPFRMVDCTLEKCWMISSVGDDLDTSSTGHVEFTRLRTTNTGNGTIPGGLWGILQTFCRPGMDYIIDDCDFDAPIYIWRARGADITDNVFREGIRSGTGTQSFYDYQLDNFTRNFVPFDAYSMSLRYGDGNSGNTFTDSIFWNTNTTNFNPHFHVSGGGEGVCTFNGCIWGSEYSGGVPEGDGVFAGVQTSGTVNDNKYRFHECIMLPNANGYGDAGHHSATLVTWLYSGILAKVEAESCTVCVGASWGAMNLGETNAFPVDSMGAFRSNLVLGISTGGGHKFRDMGELAHPGMDLDSVDPTLVDYNGSYNISQGAANADDPLSGKGYPLLSYTGGPALLGANDVDDVDPQFVDTTRTPQTWAVSKGEAATLEAVMDLLAFDGAGTMQELLDYIRDGWAPQNTAYQATGYLGVDIGAVPVVVVASTKKGRMLL